MPRLGSSQIETAFTSLIRDNPRLLGALLKALAGKAPII
jgi:hypothetical protein